MGHPMNRPPSGREPEPALSASRSQLGSVSELCRPHPDLWKYYLIASLLTGPGLFAVLPFLYFRYRTLCYRFDSEGVRMRVGILFRREFNLTYARIQDIHLRSNVLQRWFGLAKLEIETASGSSAAGLVIEGFKEFGVIRDFLYMRMRGTQTGLLSPSETLPLGSVDPPRDAVSLLLGVRDELRRTRELLESANQRASPTDANRSPHG